MNRKTSATTAGCKSSKQTTLFQNWSTDQNVRENEGLPSKTNQQNEMDEQFDEETLLAACEEWEMEELGNGSTTGPHPPEATPLEDLPGFDVSAGHIYIYPINYPLRDYQFNIVRQALFKNTLVTLPTGLGKTFIAAVVMYNFYRWYPRGKIVFMAPTKPLVFQQIEACFNIMGIPQEDMAEMTGNMHPPERKKSWQRQRVFFLTPQVMTNDLSRRACPATEVKCVVVDEAHKALGNQAYCQVIRELSKYTNQFRVLALSATPGGDIKAVNEVLTNLLISHIEIRSEDSIDIRQYVHERKVEKIVVPIGDELKQVKEQYLQILKVFVNRLVRCRVLFCRDPENLTKFQILKSREQFRQDPPPEITAARRGPVEGDFAICMSLYHGFELLLQHGQRSLYSFLQNIVDGTKANARTRSELMRNSDFSNLVEMLEAKYASSMMNSSHNISHNSSHNSSGLFTSMVSPSLRATGSKVEEEEYVMSHPKMTKLKEVVLEHFEKFTSGNQTEAGPSTSRASNKPSTRVMIFAQYRDSVQEITQMLNRHQPTVRCMSFIGQASAGKNTKGFSQKEQIRVVNEFKNGGYNTLVSTCVGEEGLDIGDVDLIVCFDAHKSPIRLVQRMGRTGRKRQGRIVMLVTEGKESAIYDRSQYSKKGIHRALQGNSKSLHLFPASPRMVPRGLNPTAHKMNIKVGEYRSKHKTKIAPPSSTAAASKRKSSMGGDISRFLQGTKPDPAEDVFLTYEELVFWNLHYKVDQGEQLKAPPESKFLSLNKQAAEEVSLPNDKELSLNSYAEWQTNKHPTHKVSHSRRCAVFVEMMEFFEIQGHTEDEDIYGAEMAMYLDEGDVLRPNDKEIKGKEGILKYCSQENKKHKETDIVILDEDERDGDHKERTRKIKKKAKVRKRAKSTSSEMENLGSDDGLPAVDLFSEPSEKQDGYSENTEKHKGKSVAKKGRKSDDGSSSDGKVGRTKRGKSPRGGQESRLKRKTIPLPCDSDENDFDTDRKSVTPPRPVVANAEGEVKQQKSANTEEGMTDSDHGALNDEPMDTASDDNQVKPCAASPSSPSKNQQEPAKSDTSLNTSEIFLSCSQVFRAPEVPSSSSKRDKRTSERSNGEGEADLMPPPPPSLSGLDLLDDIDLSFNASQLAREDNWTKSSPKRDSHRPEIDIALDEPVIVPPLPLRGKETMTSEKNGEELNMRTNLVTSETFSKAVQNDNGLDISSTATCHINHDMDDEFGKILDSDSDEVDEAVSNFENGKINQEEADVSFLKSPVLNKHSLMKCVQVQQSVDDIDHEEETKNITDELVDAWEKFEGDIFDDDDNDAIFDREPISNHLTKSPILSTNVKKVVGRKGDVKNDTLASHACEENSEDTDQRNGFKVSTASHNIKPWTDINHGMTERPGIEIKHKEEISGAVLCSSSNQCQNIQPQLEHEITDENEIKHTQQPKFDLDFDFGDFFDMDDEAFDEIGIVPPSPQVSQKRSGFMAMSQASQSRIRPERDAKTSHTDKDGSKVDIIEEQEAKLENNLNTQNQVIPMRNCGLSALESSKPSKIEAKTSSLSRFKRNLMHPVNTNDSKVVMSLAQPEKMETADFVGNVYNDAVSRVAHPPAASTPVMSDVERDGRHQGSTVSPIGHSVHRDISPVETPSSHLQKAKPLGSLRSRLRIKRKDGSGPKQSEGSSIQDLSSRPTALPGKRKSSPLVDEGHFEDPVLSNPLKKPKTSLKEETSLSPDGIEGHVIKPSLGLKSGKMEDKDDINFLLEGIDWEDSFLCDNKPTIPDRVNDGFDNKRDSIESTTSKKGTHSPSDDTNLSHHLKDNDEDSDDSQDVIGRVTKKKRAVVLTSPDTPMAFKTSLRSRLAAKASIVKEKSVHVLSDESSDDSSFIIQPKKRKAKKILDMSSTIIIPEGDDDDFEDPMKQAKLVKNIEREQQRDNVLLKQRLEKKEKRNKHNKSSNHRRKAAHFLDEEAEVSEDEECSSDEEGSDLDNSLEGFINNASQSSQTTCPRDMHAIYMKSVKSPPVPGPVGRFKMVQHRSPDLDVFSQVPQQDATYMEDSFVVQGDDEEDHGLREDISLLAMDNTINLDNIIDGGSRRAGGRRLRKKGGESKAARILRAGRAAVLKSDSSLSDVEEAVEDDDLMEWEIELDFEARKKNQKRNHTIHQASGRGRPLGNHRGLGNRMESSKPSGGEWIRKHKTQSQPFQVNPKNVQGEMDGMKKVQGEIEKEKSPLKTNYALMNSGRTKDSLISSDKVSSKPRTFVAPQPATASSSSSSLMDSPKTLAQKEKEERLRRQKQKQAEFQQKMQQKQAQASSQAVISPVKRTLSLSSGSCKKEEVTTEKTSANRTLSFATPGSNPRAAFPNSEGFKVPGSSEGSLNTKTDSANSDTSSKSASTVFTSQNISLPPDRSTTVVSASNKINNLTLMDNSVANATMSSTIVNSSALSSPRSATGQAPLVILVDSKELSSSPHIVSTLTITYGLNPIVSQLQGCDYVTSTRMGVEKRTLSEFANGANRQKLLDRVRHMCELFDRPCLIIEKDRDKNKDKRQPPKTLIRTKYLDSTLASLTKTHVKVLFSDSTEETAQILADLTKIESRKGAAIPAILDMDSTSEQVLKFYQSIPGVSYVTALSLMHHYPSVAELLSTCESVLQSRIKVSSVRAKQIMAYINHSFDEQMTGSR